QPGLNPVANVLGHPLGGALIFPVGGKQQGGGCHGTLETILVLDRDLLHAIVAVAAGSLRLDRGYHGGTSLRFDRGRDGGGGVRRGGLSGRSFGCCRFGCWRRGGL